MSDIWALPLNIAALDPRIRGDRQTVILDRLLDRVAVAIDDGEPHETPNIAPDRAERIVRAVNEYAAFQRVETAANSAAMVLRVLHAASAHAQGAGPGRYVDTCDCEVAKQIRELDAPLAELRAIRHPDNGKRGEAVPV